MTSFEIGKMFWGKSLSYPWWPCVIVPNDKNETFRNRRKLGFQYHVQFIGSEYDVCWITDSFLIEYLGKERFELFVEEQLTSNLSAQEKVKFDMRMSSSIQVLWIQACHDAERIFSMSLKDRLAELPKSLNVSQNSIPNTITKDVSNIISTVIRTTPKRNPSKGSIVESLPDQSLETKDNVVKKPKPKKKSQKRPFSKVSDNEDDSDIDTDSKDILINNSKQRRKSQNILLSKESDHNNESGNESDSKETERQIKKKKITKRSFQNLSDFEDDEEINKGHTEMPDADEQFLTDDIEERCFIAYMAKETCHRLNDFNSTIAKSTLENMLKEQWAALDIDLKLQYLNDEDSYLGASKSKVSGRQIKIPSRLRRTEDIKKIKRLSSKKRPSEPPIKKVCTKSLSSVISIKTEDTDVVTSCQSSSSPIISPSNNTYRETIDRLLWNSLTIQDCSSEMMRIVVMKSLPEVRNVCCYCFKALYSDKTVICKGDCQSSYHLLCAVENKIIRSDDTSLCVNCNHKHDLCCICNNSKYMKKQYLVKCQKEGCPCHFHVTCVKYLTFIERKASENNPVLCPKHTCLTCSREDYKHKCNKIGPFVSCIKCPIAYHDNLVCIPAGCRIIGKNKLICYRHFDNSFVLKKTQQLTRCFVCFNDSATLKCCRCRAVFHPKCMSLATYTDLLRDYVCTTCKLEQPMFQGQIVWIEMNKKWIPAEIVSATSLMLEDVHERFAKTLTVRHLESNQYCFSNRCELIPFSIGISVLIDNIEVDDPVVQLAKIKDLLYWNWRARLRPLTSEKYTLLCQSDLMKYSVNNYQSPDQTVNKYDFINANIVPEHVQKVIPSKTSEFCDCESFNGTCNDDNCCKFTNDIECSDSSCTNLSCNNRLFAQRCPARPIVINNSISNRGVNIGDSFNENQLLGVCNGTLMLASDVFKEMHKRDQLDSVSYIFCMSENIFLNCEHVGNEWRYLNHSCEPNAKLVCKNVDGCLTLGVFALKSIFGEEITIDYRKSIVLKYGFLCQCLSPSCSQIIGPTSLFLTETKLVSPLCCTNSDIIKPIVDMSPTLTIRRLNTTPIKSSFDSDNPDNCVIDDRNPVKTSCYKCGTHGEFITCDRGNCHKQFHMMCVEISTKPAGRWLCPIHFCCHCNCAATIFCEKCPISSCKKHSKLHSTHICTMDPGAQDFVESQNMSEEIIKTEHDLTSLSSEKNEESNTEDINQVQRRVEELSFEDPVNFEIIEKEETIDEDMEIYNEYHNSFNAGNFVCVEREEVIVEQSRKKEDDLHFEKSEIYNEDCVYTRAEEFIVEDDTTRLYLEKEEMGSEKEVIIIGDTDNITPPTKESAVVEDVHSEKEETFIEDTRTSAVVLEITEEVVKERIFQEDSISTELIGISKDDLYESCDLVPIVANNSPSQVNMMIGRTFHNSKMPGDDIRSSDQRKSESSSTVCNISNYLSNDEESIGTPELRQARPELDFDDIRSEIIPFKIEDQEDTIISPCIIDD